MGASDESRLRAEFQRMRVERDAATQRAVQAEAARRRDETAWELRRQDGKEQVDRLIATQQSLREDLGQALAERDGALETIDRLSPGSVNRMKDELRSVRADLTSAHLAVDAVRDQRDSAQARVEFLEPRVEAFEAEMHRVTELLEREKHASGVLADEARRRGEGLEHALEAERYAIDEHQKLAERIEGALELLRGTTGRWGDDLIEILDPVVDEIVEDDRDPGVVREQANAMVREASELRIAPTGAVPESSSPVGPEDGSDLAGRMIADIKRTLERWERYSQRRG